MVETRHKAPSFQNAAGIKEADFSSRLDWDEIWHECSSYHINFNMVAVTSFHTENCCHPMIDTRHLPPPILDLQYIVILSLCVFFLLLFLISVL